MIIFICFLSDNARGKKLIRLVRRVSGLLLQLTVFELPTAVAMAAYEATKIQLLSELEIPQEKKIGEDLLDGTENEGSACEVEHRGFAEERAKTTILTKYPPPAFRIVGFDPKSRRKVTLGIEPQAIIEVAGGVFSPYLDPSIASRRKELAKVVCDSLVLVFPGGGQPFELMLPWSGSRKESSGGTNVSSGDTTKDSRSSAERVNKRPGRIFRSAMKISKYELIVTIFTTPTSSNDDSTQHRNLDFNFYSPAASEATDLIVTESQQEERLGGSRILSYSEGVMRAAVIRRFCKFFRAEIIEDILDPHKKTLDVTLLPPDKGFITDYQQIGTPSPGDDVRPVGYPSVFFPLNTCGRPLHRRGMTLFQRQSCTNTKIERHSEKSQEQEFLVTLYTKSSLENAERGLVVKLYNRSNSETSILHIGPSELMRICSQAQEPDLLQDLVKAQEQEDELQLDSVEGGFSEITEKGGLIRQTQHIINQLMDIVCNDLGYFLDPQEKVVPFIKSAPRGILPE